MRASISFSMHVLAASSLYWHVRVLYTAVLRRDGSNEVVDHDKVLLSMSVVMSTHRILLNTHGRDVLLCAAGACSSAWRTCLKGNPVRGLSISVARPNVQSVDAVTGCSCPLYADMGLLFSTLPRQG